MTRNKTIQEVHNEYEAVVKEMSTLRNRQTSLKLLYQFQRQGVVRPYSTGFVTGTTK